MEDSDVCEEFQRVSFVVPTTDFEVPTQNLEIEDGIVESVGHTLILQERKELERQVASIHLIPPEILLEIWGYNCEVEYSLAGWGVFPLVASWVSRYWRNFAINTSDLWCSVVLCPGLSSELLKVQLERSGNYLLRVAINLDCSRSKLMKLLDIVMTHIDRWDMLCVVCVRIAADVLKLLRHVRAPRLKHLDMRSVRDEIMGPIFAGGTPVLSDVAFRRVDIRANLALLIGLTSLSLARAPHLCHITHAELRDVIHASPRLSRLALRGRCVLYSSTDASSYPSIHAPFLRSLSISGVDELFVSNFFLVLSAPELQSLELADILPDPLKEFLAVMNITTISYPRLSKLILNEVIAGHSQVTQLLQCFPSIDYLELNCSKGYKYLSALIFDDEVLCPRLHTFAWLYPFGNGCAKGIRDLVSRRISVELPIVRLHLRSDDFLYLQKSFRDWFGARVHVELFV